ncbi:MAG TPA: Mur ligase family protein [Candidatus Saccharimonadales bacterium]|nr:Mur ligase family protein [Candidatus Saccharimonadales bacterium]
MPVITDFSQANALLRQLYGQYKTGGGAAEFYSLDRIRSLMAYLHNPQDSLRVLHIAGTSGKSSTAYFVAALLKASGAFTGLSVSPHIFEVNERLQLDLIPLAEHDFCSALGEFMDKVDKSCLQPSYFELLVALAYETFSARKVDYAVMEVGLGGLLDGTNVVTRQDKVCLITDIGLDHTRVLGKTIAQIARQKAGIIQPGNQVFMHRQAAEVMDVVHETCQAQAATLHIIDTDSITGMKTSIPDFQQRNLSLAAAAVSYVLHRDRDQQLTAEAIQTAAGTPIPGRMSIFMRGRQTIIVDGAHNEQKMGALVRSLQAAYPNQQISALLAVVNGPDERWQQTLDILLPHIDSAIVTSFYQETDDRIKSSADPDTVGDYLKAHTKIAVTVVPELGEAYQLLMEQPESVLLITGSLYFLHDILPLAAMSTKPD